MPKSTDNNISCPAAIADGQVCAHAVTVAQLHSWGIDSEIILDHLHIPGPRFHVALMQAWRADHVRMCTLDPHSTGRPWLTPRVQSPESIADALALPKWKG